VLQKTLAEQQVRFAVVRDYFGVIVAEASRNVAAGAVHMAESDLRRAQDRIDAGLGVQSDVLAAQVQLAEFRQQQIQAEGNHATALVILNVSMGLPTQNQYKLTAELLPKDFPLPAQEELLRQAILNRPEYAQSGSAIQLAEQRVSERRADYLPELNVFGSFGSSARNLVTGSTDYAVGAGLTFNLFDAARGSRISQARIEESLAKNERDRLTDQIVVEVARAYHDYRASEQQLEVAEATLYQATEALRIIQDRYEAGLTTITDVLRAETTLVRAQTNVIASRQNQYVRYATILLETGELNDVRVFER
jgi:outer membrane protein TolC